MFQWVEYKPGSFLGFSKTEERKQTPRKERTKNKIHETSETLRIKTETQLESTDI